MTSRVCVHCVECYVCIMTPCVFVAERLRQSGAGTTVCMVELGRRLEADEYS